MSEEKPNDVPRAAVISKPPTTNKAGGRVAVGGVLAVLAVAAAVAVGVVPRLRQHATLDAVEQEQRGPRRVRVGAVTAGAAIAEVTLPGTSSPFFSTQIYANSNGYMRKSLVEVGDRVKSGQRLAEIVAHEADADLRSAEARYDEARANLEIVQRTAERSKELATAGVQSQQQAEDARALANSSASALKARKAELDRLRDVRGYQEITAPFDGVVTRRALDPGALVGPARAGGPVIFEVAKTDLLRVVVDVPQGFAHDVVPGVPANVYLASAPTSGVVGKVARTSGVLDASTRTLHVEVQIPGDGPILPGAFVYVRLSVPRPKAPAKVSANALIVRKEGTLVARIVDGKIALTPIAVARDLGKELEVASGVAPGDQVVLNPSDDLREGEQVTVVENKPDGGV
jgi:RND family efflux transporter MFP subunit